MSWFKSRLRLWARAGRAESADPTLARPIGLVLTGGGARAAYQVGVLAGIRRVLLDAGWPPQRNPFRVFTGTSAGAINATVLAAGADDLFEAIARLALVWGSFEPAQVYRVDASGALGNAARWIGGAGLGWLARRQPRSLFDTDPLQDLLSRTIDYQRIAANLASGHFDALAVSASSYTSGRHVTFFQAREIHDPMMRSQRIAYPAVLGTTHLMASSAIPFLFPAQSLPIDGREEYFGDGSMRQTAPISPAIHLGATRILVIGSAATERPEVQLDLPPVPPSYPTLAQIGAHALASMFLDALASDIERLERINRTIAAVPAEHRQRIGLRPLQALVISPSRPLDQLAEHHVRQLPRSVRALLRVAGGTRGRGTGVSSYLLFDCSYTRRLLAMGRRDALNQRDRIEAFFDVKAAGVKAAGTESPHGN
ncbi:MAG: patatin-like phospholipase family protein [Lautropia sp.]